MKKKGKWILTVLGGLCMIGGFVIDTLKDGNEREEMKQELKQEIMLELRGDAENESEEITN